MPISAFLAVWRGLVGEGWIAPTFGRSRWQCLQTIAASWISSAQKGHFFITSPCRFFRSIQELRQLLQGFFGRPVVTGPIGEHAIRTDAKLPIVVYS